MNDFDMKINDGLKSFFRFVFVVGVVMSITACSDTITWREEVKLNDGRVIVVTQKRRCSGGYTGGNIASCIEREAWLTVKLPESGEKEVVWHENLKPNILNIDNGQLFIVGRPPTGREFNQYGKPQPPYLGFRLESGQWKPIRFSEIPEAIYDANLVIDGAFVQVKLLTLAEKNGPKLNGNSGYPKYVRKIDPSHRSNFD